MTPFSLTPSQEQLLGQVRILLTLAGSVAATFGLLAPDQVGGLTAGILDLTGIVMIGGASAWSFYNNTIKALVHKVDVIAKDPASPVQGVITANNVAGHELAASIPGSTTVAAGTIQAVNLARS